MSPTSGPTPVWNTRQPTNGDLLVYSMECRDALASANQDKLLIRLFFESVKEKLAAGEAEELLRNLEKEMK